MRVGITLQREELKPGSLVRKGQSKAEAQERWCLKMLVPFQKCSVLYKVIQSVQKHLWDAQLTVKGRLPKEKALFQVLESPRHSEAIYSSGPRRHS